MKGRRTPVLEFDKLKRAKQTDNITSFERYIIYVLTDKGGLTRDQLRQYFGFGTRTISNALKDERYRNEDVESRKPGRKAEAVSVRQLRQNSRMRVNELVIQDEDPALALKASEFVLMSTDYNFKKPAAQPKEKDAVDKIIDNAGDIFGAEEEPEGDPACMKCGSANVERAPENDRKTEGFRCLDCGYEYNRIMATDTEEPPPDEFDEDKADADLDDYLKDNIDEEEDGLQGH